MCVHLFACACVSATNWSEAISLAQNLGKLSSANLNKVTNHTLLSSVCCVQTANLEFIWNTQRRGGGNKIQIKVFLHFRGKSLRDRESYLSYAQRVKLIFYSVRFCLCLKLVWVPFIWFEERRQLVEAGTKSTKFWYFKNRRTKKFELMCVCISNLRSCQLLPNESEFDWIELNVITLICFRM